eukprot:g33656.t1
MSEDDALDSEVDGVVREDLRGLYPYCCWGREFESKSAGNGGDVVEGILDYTAGETIVPKVGGYLGCPGVERLIMGTDMAEMEELRIWDSIFAG